MSAEFAVNVRIPDLIGWIPGRAYSLNGAPVNIFTFIMETEELTAEDAIEIGRLAVGEEWAHGGRLLRREA